LPDLLFALQGKEEQKRNNYNYYEAETQGFSYFAAITRPIETPVPTPQSLHSCDSNVDNSYDRSYETVHSGLRSYLRNCRTSCSGLSAQEEELDFRFSNFLIYSLNFIGGKISKQSVNK